MERFPKDASTLDEAVRYYKNRAIYFLPLGWTWAGTYRTYDWGVETVFKAPTGIRFWSVYVIKRNKGHLGGWFKEHPYRKFVTSDDCPEMLSWLNKRRINYSLIETNKSEAYKLVTKFYGNDRAKRSGLYHMNHVDEGLFILNELGADQDTLDAWCLHPIFQDDRDLLNAQSIDLSKISQRSILYAMEYRQRANAHLSFNKKKVPEPIRMKSVMQMLQADKIQNCKDFEFYLKNRSDVTNDMRLRSYFHDEWFKALNISEEMYREMSLKIDKYTGYQGRNYREVRLSSDLMGVLSS